MEAEHRSRQPGPHGGGDHASSPPTSYDPPTAVTSNMRRTTFATHPNPSGRGEGDGRSLGTAIVVGSANSSTSVRLVEVAKEHGAAGTTSWAMPRTSAPPRP